jgi:hypothetical protein
MQVLCVATEVSDEESSDVTCAVCGHPFKLYFERKSAAERAEATARVEQALASHHDAGDDTSVHPDKPFNVPEWSGRAEWSGAALLGGAPAWAA